jgi:ATP-dependent RNA helicase RhlE
VNICRAASSWRLPTTLRKEFFLPSVNFSSLGLTETILRALRTKGYSAPTPIQQQAIPCLLAGEDVLGIAQTGTGKTAAFALPILQQLAAARERSKPNTPRALVLAPTRELAVQIHDDFRDYGAGLGLRQTVILGGVSQRPQVAALARRTDIVVATPGRLLDLFEQGYIRLDRIAFFVLDEADRMLDMGFIHDVRKIIRELPSQRRSMLFSATMPPDVARLAQKILHRPKRVEVTPSATTVDTVQQLVYFVNSADKPKLLGELLHDSTLSRVLVFARTKHRANRVAEHVSKMGVAADAIHGNKSQTARQRALERFRAGHSRVLVATDIAARGLDVDSISHVINFELPHEPEGYVHRIGRTARAGASGSALSFCDPAERSQLRHIEKLIGVALKVVQDQPFHATTTVDNPPGQRAHGRPTSGRDIDRSGNGVRSGGSRRPIRRVRKGAPAFQAG